MTEEVGFAVDPAAADLNLSGHNLRHPFPVLRMQSILE